MIANILRTLLSLAALAWMVAWGGQASAQSAAEELEDYIAVKKCTTAQQVECLAATTARACASGCLRRGYGWRVNTAGEIDLHLTHEFLRHLRNAALSEPAYQSSATFGLPLSSLLYEQVQMLLRQPTVQYNDSALNVLPLSAVTGSSHTIDPSRFYMVTWRRNGIAHAMGQTDLGSWLVSVASWYAQLEDQTKASYYLRLSEKVYRPLTIRQAEGGARNDLKGYRCYDGQFCYWFHSCPVCTKLEQTTVLNQHLHAVRDVLESHSALETWRSGGLRIPRTGEPAPFPPVLSSRFIRELRDLSRGGLFQLAFSAGNAAHPLVPPNLRELLWPAQIAGGRQRYHAAYRYYLGDGPANIASGNTCHYHFHSVELLAHILNLIHTNPHFNDDPYFVEIYYRLLYGRSRGDTRSCNNRASIPPSRRVMNGVPMAELYQGSVLLLDFHENCDDVPKSEDEDAVKWRNGEADGPAPHPPRVILDSAYKDCIF